MQLLEAGADIEAETDTGERPIHIAIKASDIRILKVRRQLCDISLLTLLMSQPTFNQLSLGYQSASSIGALCFTTAFCVCAKISFARCRLQLFLAESCVRAFVDKSLNFVTGVRVVNVVSSLS